MKHARQIAIVCSSLLALQSTIFFMSLLWFNRFSSGIFVRIPETPQRMLVLYWGIILGLTSLYTAFHYKKPGYVASSFFLILGFIGVANVVYLAAPLTVNFIFVIYLILLSLGFLYVGIAGFLYRIAKVEPVQKKEGSDDTSNNQSIQAR